MSPFQSAKLELIGLLGLSRDALHIHVGLAAMLGVAALFRLSLMDWRPLAAAVLAALAGELWDLVDHLGAGRSPDWGGNWHDIANTLFWPILLFLVARYTRLLRR